MVFRCLQQQHTDEAEKSLTLIGKRVRLAVRDTSSHVHEPGCNIVDVGNIAS